MVLAFNLTADQTQEHPHVKSDIQLIHYHRVGRATVIFLQGKEDVSYIPCKPQLHPHHEHPHSGMNAS